MDEDIRKLLEGDGPKTYVGQARRRAIYSNKRPSGEQYNRALEMGQPPERTAISSPGGFGVYTSGLRVRFISSQDAQNPCDDLAQGMQDMAQSMLSFGMSMAVSKEQFRTLVEMFREPLPEENKMPREPSRAERRHPDKEPEPKYGKRWHKKRTLKDIAESFPKKVDSQEEP